MVFLPFDPHGMSLRCYKIGFMVPPEPSPFGRLALKLDRELSELARAGDQIGRVNLDSDNGLDEGVRILNRVAQLGESAAATMQEFSKSLDEAREKAEAATQLVAERAQIIKRRRQREDELREQLTQVKEGIKTLGAGLAGFNKPEKGELTEDSKRRIAAELERLQAPMTRCIEAAQAVKAEASRSNFKRLERQADSVIDSLQASRRKIVQAIAPK
jgi:hypothetical protein